MGKTALAELELLLGSPASYLSNELLLGLSVIVTSEDNP